MATSLLLRSLSRRVLHPTTSAISTYRCLTDNVKKQRSATSPLGKNLMSLASRPFSSKPAGDVVPTVAEVPMDYKIVEAPGGDAWVEVKEAKGVQRYSLSQFGPFAFTTIKKTKEFIHETTLSKAVIVVPSYYNDDQRNAAEDAATIAGFDVLKIVTDESFADECSYGIINGKTYRHLAILDLSRGFFSVDIEKKIPVSDASEMLEALVREIKIRHGKDIRNYPLAFQRLEEEVEKVCLNISTSPDSKTNIVKFEESVGGELISLTIRMSK